MLNTNLPLMNRNIYHPAIGCSCGLHTGPTLLQSVCNLCYTIQRVISGLIFVTRCGIIDKICLEAYA